MRIIQNDYHIPVHIDDESSLTRLGPNIVVDVEDNEAGTFVGIGICDSPERVFYFPRLSEAVVAAVASRSLIGHNIKYDAKQLASWGVPIKAKNLLYDTMLASYVENATKESHGLKELCSELFGTSRPRYKDLVGTGRKKETLDRKPVDLVASYCSCDVIDAHKLHSHFQTHLTDTQKKYLEEIELPIMRLLFEMEQRGVMVDVDYLRKLDAEFAVDIERLSLELQRLAGRSDREGGVPFNLRSPKQVKDVLLSACGLRVASTNAKTLKEHKDVPLIQTLLAFRQIDKLRGTYTNGLLQLASLPIVHTTFNQIRYDTAEDDWAGIHTGRLSSSGPNLQNIPTRTEVGNRIRRVFRAREGCKLIVADYGQIEPRIIAHSAQDKKLLDIFNSGRDPYEEQAQLIGGGCSRKVAKEITLATGYGARATKIAERAGITVEEAEGFLSRYWRTFTGVAAWKSTIIARARLSHSITTLLGRTIQIVGWDSGDRFERWGAERRAVNYTIQGSAAEVIKKAMIACHENGFTPILQVHDELLFEYPEAEVQEKAEAIKDIMEMVVELSVPLTVNMGIGTTWQEGKK